MPLFEEYIGIDYSGGGRPDQPNAGIQVCQVVREVNPEFVENSHPRRKNWSRRDLAGWLTEALRDKKHKIIGIDHAFSFPQSHLDSNHCDTWDDLLRHFDHKWKTREQSVEEAIGGSNPYDDERDLRLTEKWTSSAKSVFQLKGQGIVGKSTHAGLPWLLDLRQEFQDKVHFWPFDGFSTQKEKSVVAEVYPSIFRNRYRVSIEVQFPGIRLSTDMLDAAAVCLWLREFDRRNLLGRYFEVPLTKTERRRARREGWILGIL